MKRNVIALIVCGMFFFSFSAFAGPLPDTGQTECYNDVGDIIPCPEPGEAFYGQDGNYLINPPSYTKLDASGNDLPDTATSWAMVRDNVTKLIWEVKTEDGSIHDKDDVYIWQDAQDVFIEQVNVEKFGGHSDWRLPNQRELGSIVDYTVLMPAINALYFPNTVSSHYWSATTYVSSTSYAWGVSFYVGEKHSLINKSDGHYVRAVRSGQVAPLDHLVINLDGTVTDTNSGLMWQQGTMGPMVWKNALSECEHLTLGGYDDWRPPNNLELESIIDYTLYSPAINQTAFPNTVSSHYWSATTSRGNMGSAWAVEFRSGMGLTKRKPDGLYVRSVRGGQPLLLDHLFISAPLQGSIVEEGDSVIIRWDTAGIGGNAKISISREGGKTGTFETIVGSTKNDGRYNWTVTGPNSVNCMLKIVPLDDPTKRTTQGLFSIGTVPAMCSVDIKANDSDTTITVSPSTPISIDISLDPGDEAGLNAELWIVVQQKWQFGMFQQSQYYAYVYPMGWQAGIYPCIVMPLSELSSINVLTSTLPIGEFEFFFLIDDNVDGIPDGTWMDSVKVTVQ